MKSNANDAVKRIVLMLFFFSYKYAGIFSFIGTLFYFTHHKIKFLLTTYQTKQKITPHFPPLYDEFHPIYTVSSLFERAIPFYLQTVAEVCFFVSEFVEETTGFIENLFMICVKK